MVSWGRDSWRFRRWSPYVPVAKRRAQAARKLKALEKDGRKPEPVWIEGRTIAHSFWGKAWCENLERFSDFENRLPRGRTYARNGSVIDLKIEPGKMNALVSGSSIYKVQVKLKRLPEARWKAIQAECSVQIGSVVDLLQGKLSSGVMEVITNPGTGLFPRPNEIEMSCSCPDSARLCKHVAATLYGIGARLDTRPELLFVLRGVDHLELIGGLDAANMLAGAAGDGSLPTLAGDEMAAVFGIEIDEGQAPRAPAASPAAPRPVRRRPPARPAARSAPPPARKAPRRQYRPRQSWDFLSERIDLLREYFLEEDTLTNVEYREFFAIGTLDATRELQQLTKRGVLIQMGRKRGTWYEPGEELGA